MMTNNKKTKGFTLVETLVSLFIFGMMSVVLVNVFVSGLNTQTRILQNQDLMNQASYSLEYMGKLIRMAERDETGNCAPIGESYGVGGSYPDNSITFLAYDTKAGDYRCLQFLLEGNAIKEKRSTTDSSAQFQTAQAITSSSVYVITDGLYFFVNGDTADDQRQPMITTLINLRYNASPDPPYLTMQTTVSQRKLDI
jgi:prepilin-type N-terminal cleavage/methylation domain-containing protein